jgi:propanol-preferring alcohol dehydrogenase
MRAALLQRYNAPLELAEVPAPVAGPGEVVVRTAGCGICRTDVHIQEGIGYRPNLPHILGHEPAGRIFSLGAGVRDWEVGARVAPYLFEACGRCPACLAGNQAQCEAVAGILGVTRDGGFAEFFRVRAENLIRVPASVELETAGLVSCAAITATHAVHRAALSSGHRVAIIGAGAIGIMILQILVANGYETHIVNRSAEGRKASLADGAASVMAPDALVGEGTFDRVFDLVGTAATMGVAGRLVKRQGRIVVIGEEPEFPAIDTIALAQREIEIVGSRNGGRADAHEAMDLMARGVIRPHVARQITLDGLNDALGDMRAGKVHGRVVVGFPQ